MNTTPNTTWNTRMALQQAKEKQDKNNWIKKKMMMFSPLQLSDIHRLHYSKVQVSKMHPNGSLILPQSQFWTSLFDLISKAFDDLWGPDSLGAIF